MINYCRKTLLFFIFCTALSANASLLWNIQDGINLYNSAQYQQAKNYFVDYVKNNPNDEKGYYELARAYLKLKNNPLAVENFEKSYNLALKYKNLEKIQFKKDAQKSSDYFDMAVMYYEENNLQEADFYADLMLKLDNMDSSAWFLKAKIALSRGQKEEAVEYMNNAVLYNNKLLKTNLAKKLNIYSVPKISKEKYYSFAFQEYFKGNTEGAIRNCQNYIEINKENIDINLLLAELYLEKNDTNKALELVEASKKIDENIPTYLLEADIYEKTNDSSKQEHALLKAYKLNPNNSQMLYKTGNFYLKKEDYKKAIKYFETLTNMDDSFYEGYFGYIKCLVELGRTNDALNYIRKATQLNSEQSEINYLLAMICYKQGQMNDAKDYIEQSIEKYNNPNYLLLKAQALYYAGNYTESLKALNEIIKLTILTHNESEVDKFFIKNYLKQKNYKNAQYYLNSTDLKLDKNSLLYKYNLYKILKSEGNDKKADFLYNQIKLARLTSTKEYADLSEIIYEEEGLDSAIKLLDKAIKKTPAEPELYSQKIKIYLLARSFENAKKTSDELSEKFN